jgi:hypothetical protein
MFVATVTVEGPSGFSCPPAAASAIRSYYGFTGSSSVVGTINLFDAQVSPTLTGTGC